ncbi:CopD family protein [Caballeronia sp. LZ062]|uniref:CopD family protein n=1 Tax=unclassified Caballeronia TaxID=2646786 RepID=UPI00286673DE|nr:MULTISPECIES: CopD family protein [unclassified Caballeronia]MDR5853675.1 CopD family protein [Caballeronia sp. LZ050]MDR5871792.1 CopD family protein [Caballeronia sp. LZ062]
MTGDSLPFLQMLFAAFSDVAFACTLGAVLLRGWLHREQALATASAAQRAWRRASALGLLAALVFMLCGFVSLWLQSAAMSGASILDAGSSLWLVATATHAGIGWAASIAGGALLALAAATSRPFGAARYGVAALGALIAASGKAAIGHAADAGAFSIAEGVQLLHLLATGVWGGVVIAGAAVVLPALDASTARASLLRVVVRMSRVATLAVAVVIATGLFNAWRGTGGSAAPLTQSGWGHALIVKAALVAAALALGALNRWSALPQLQRTASTTDAHTVINLMRVEALLMAGVFLAASVLSHSLPGFALGA